MVLLAQSTPKRGAERRRKFLNRLFYYPPKAAGISFNSPRRRHANPIKKLPTNKGFTFWVLVPVAVLRVDFLCACFDSSNFPKVFIP